MDIVACLLKIDAWYRIDSLVFRQSLNPGTRSVDRYKIWKSHWNGSRSLDKRLVRGSFKGDILEVIIIYITFPADEKVKARLDSVCNSLGIT